MGLIPAGAGNIGDARPRGIPRRAHPRRCGEHGTNGNAGAIFSGSSPQVRGTSFVLASDGEDLRLIPAGAGNMMLISVSVSVLRAHPRRCGEHSVRSPDVQSYTGSSPQVRGTFGREPRHGVAHRLIPAGAGNIRAGRYNCSVIEAHPRRCGEHSRELNLVHDQTGSSPQVRGTLLPVRPRGLQRGLIPAGAGNMSRGRL